jgi:hypothetical protein
MSTICFRKPIRLAMLVAARASVGAITAPNTKPILQGHDSLIFPLGGRFRQRRVTWQRLGGGSKDSKNRSVLIDIPTWLLASHFLPKRRLACFDLI